MAKEAPRHQEHDILAFIDRYHPELKDRREIAISLASGIYHVVVTDQSHVKHTLKIDAKRIDEDQIIRARLDRILAPKPKTHEEVARHSGRRIDRAAHPDGPNED